MTIVPIDDRIVVMPKEEDNEKISGGIILPDSAKEKPQSAIIKAIGTDEGLKELFEIGDEIFYNQYQGTEIKIEGKKYIVLSRNDVLVRVY